MRVCVCVCLKEILLLNNLGDYLEKLSLLFLT